MKKTQLVSVIAMVIMLLTLQGVCLAEVEQASMTQEETATVTLTGKVTAVKNDMGELISINLLVVDNAVETEYRVTLDEMGKKLADMNGMTAVVTAKVMDENGLKWLTISQCTKQE